MLRDIMSRISGVVSQIRHDLPDAQESEINVPDTGVVARPSFRSRLREEKAFWLAFSVVHYYGVSQVPEQKEQCQASCVLQGCLQRYVKQNMREDGARYQDGEKRGGRPARRKRLPRAISSPQTKTVTGANIAPTEATPSVTKQRCVEVSSIPEGSVYHDCERLLLRTGCDRLQQLRFDKKYVEIVHLARISRCNNP